MSIFTNGIARVFVPYYLKEKNGEEFYLNVNLVYGLWKDVQIKFLNQMQNQGALA